MLNKLKKTNREGFTIIEVMIVLAIAGLILLIVFLAVPALQRNARNTTRNTDVGSIVGAFNEYVDNNNGTIPAANCTGVSAPCTTFLANAKTGFYGIGGNAWSATNFIYTYSAAAQAGQGTNNVNDVHAYNFESCTGTAGVLGSNPNAVAFIYYVETGSATNQEECKTAS